MKSVSIDVFGKVQGVWFRASTQRKARELAITGFVKNNSDGSVHIEAHGSEEAIAALERWCALGPRHAQVDMVKSEEALPSLYHDFEIRRAF